MRGQRLWALLVAAALSFSVSAQQSPQQPFRAGVDVVTLDVSVAQRNVPVQGLAAADFLLTDNGVRQTVEAVSADSLPLDVTLVVDTSGSMVLMQDELKRQIRAASGLLKPQDRLRLIGFAWVAKQVFALQPASADLPLDRFSAGGGTSLTDTLVTTLIQIRPPGRNQLAVVFTDGADTVSSISMPMVQELARRSDVPVHVFIVRSPEEVAIDAAFGRPDYTSLADLASATGGRLQSLLADNQIGVGLARVLEDYRTSYTLRFTATGVTRAGWHDLSVGINRPGEFVVRARKGYFGGG